MIPLRVSKQHIQEFVFESGFDPVIARLPKDFYYLPDRDWIEREFSRELFNRLLGLTYSQWKWVCADYARFAASFAAECHARKGAQSDGGILFGEFDYIHPEQVGHVLNVTICPNSDGKWQFVTYEPQQQRIVNLTKERFATCFAMRF